MSPEVWNDAKPRIAAAAASVGMPIVWPNEAAPDPKPDALWLVVEAAGGSEDPIELIGGEWQESGNLWLHVMVPTGSGIDSGLAARKALANAFRSITDAAPGIVYQGNHFDPSGPATDDGTFQRLTLIVSYIFQDRTT